MKDLSALTAPLAAMAACARQAARYDVNSPAYAVQERAFERTLARVTAQATRLVSGQPRHRKAVRTVLAAVEQASRCADAIRRWSSADELVWRAEALERATRDVAALTANLGRQGSERVDEEVVGERPWTELANVFNAFGSGQSSQAVEHQSVDQATAVTTLGASDEHASVAEQQVADAVGHTHSA